MISQHRMDVMLRQLRTGTNFVYFQEDVVCYGKRTVDEHYLEAIDVMLELTYCEPEFYSCERLDRPAASLHRADREAVLSPHSRADGYPVPHYGDTAQWKGRGLSGSRTGRTVTALSFPVTIFSPSVRRTAPIAFLARRSRKKYNARRIRVWQERRSPQKRKPPRPSRSKKVQRQTSAT